MTDVLARIVERKRREVAERLVGTPTAEPTARSLSAALARPGARFIMEVKQRSPSGHRSRATLEQAVAAYAPIADAISVLTDGEDFGGSLDDLRRVRERFDGPILAKDFIVDRRQVAEARAHGADAALAMMSVLDDDSARRVLDEARRLGMGVIIEVHDQRELDRALALDPAIVGINNRDLTTLGIDLATTERLAAQVPNDVLVISESGIMSNADVRRLSPMVDAFLVGSSLMAADDIAAAARRLVFGEVKICGLTRAEDVVAAATVGATHAGLVFVPESPRALDLEAARPLATVARANGLRTVGVFRGAPVEEIVAIARELGLDVIQLHGRDDMRNAATLRQALPEVELWGVCEVDGADAPVDALGVDRIIYDSPGGGTGTAFDWSAIKDRSDLPSSIVAGGISPENARTAAALGAFAIDVSSGVERAPGIKDADRLQHLFAAIRPASRKNT